MQFQVLAYISAGFFLSVACKRGTLHLPTLKCPEGGAITEVYPCGDYDRKICMRCSQRYRPEQVCNSSTITTVSDDTLTSIVHLTGTCNGQNQLGMLIGYESNTRTNRISHTLVFLKNFATYSCSRGGPSNHLASDEVFSGFVFHFWSIAYYLPCKYKYNCDILAAPIEYNLNASSIDKLTPVIFRNSVNNLGHSEQTSFTVSFSRSRTRRLTEVRRFEATSSNSRSETGHVNVKAGVSIEIPFVKANLEVEAGISYTHLLSGSNTIERTTTKEYTKQEGHQLSWDFTCPPHKFCIADVIVEKVHCQVPYKMFFGTEFGPTFHESCVERGIFHMDQAMHARARVRSFDKKPN